MLTGVGFTSRYKVAKAITTKKPSEAVFVLEAIYKKSNVFKYPEIFQCNNMSEFKSDVTKLLEKHNVNIRRARYKYIHTAFVEAFKKALEKSCLSPWRLKNFKTLKKY